MLKHNLKEAAFYGLFGAAILLTAWKGTMDWMAIAVIACILKLPGTRWIRDLFNRKKVD